MGTKALAPRPKSVKLKPLQWVVRYRGKKRVYKFANPLVDIVNKFNEENAKFGMVASLD